MKDCRINHFWIWNIEEHKLEDIKTNGDCCFNHIIGLPSKDTVDKPLYDYEKIIFDYLVTQNGRKHLWIKKATGLGISEFMLRFMAWLCLKDNFQIDVYVNVYFDRSRSMGIDPAYGSSAFGIVVTEWADGIV